MAREIGGAPAPHPLERDRGCDQPAGFSGPRDFSDLGSYCEEQRRSKIELWRYFEVARPQILGALLDAVAQGLKPLIGKGN
jgi:hypothetical protein